MASKFEEMFGTGGHIGRPKGRAATGIVTGDPKITEEARRRARRVLLFLHRDEFEELMLEEAEHLMSQSIN